MAELQSATNTRLRDVGGTTIGFEIADRWAQVACEH